MLLYFLISAVTAAVRKNVTFAAVIVDGRVDPGVIASVSNVRHHVAYHYPIYIVTNRQHWARGRQQVSSLYNTHIHNFSYTHTANMKSYNDLMISPAFWDLFTEQYILIFQRDSRFCAYSQQRIEDYLDVYDYIGAPWGLGGTNLLIGNGGFSLRSRKAMQICVRDPLLLTREPSFWNEDQWLSLCVLKRGMRYPTIRTASEFSVECCRHPGAKPPLGVHKPWAYFKNDHWLARYCPESVSY